MNNISIRTVVKALQIASDYAYSYSYRTALADADQGMTPAVQEFIDHAISEINRGIKRPVESKPVTSNPTRVKPVNKPKVEVIITGPNNHTKHLLVLTSDPAANLSFLAPWSGKFSIAVESIPPSLGVDDFYHGVDAALSHHPDTQAVMLVDRHPGLATQVRMAELLRRGLTVLLPNTAATAGLTPGDIPFKSTYLGQSPFMRDKTSRISSFHVIASDSEGQPIGKQYDFDSFAALKVFRTAGIMAGVRFIRFNLDFTRPNFTARYGSCKYWSWEQWHECNLSDLFPEYEVYIEGIKRTTDGELEHWPVDISLVERDHNGKPDYSTAMHFQYIRREYLENLLGKTYGSYQQDIIHWLSTRLSADDVRWFKYCYHDAPRPGDMADDFGYGAGCISVSSDNLPHKSLPPHKDWAIAGCEQPTSRGDVDYSAYLQIPGHTGLLNHDTQDPQTGAVPLDEWTLVNEDDLANEESEDEDTSYSLEHYALNKSTIAWQDLYDLLTTPRFEPSLDDIADKYRYGPVTPGIKESRTDFYARKDDMADEAALWDDFLSRIDKLERMRERLDAFHLVTSLSSDEATSDKPSQSSPELALARLNRMSAELKQIAHHYTGQTQLFRDSDCPKRRDLYKQFVSLGKACKLGIARLCALITNPELELHEAIVTACDTNPKLLNLLVHANPALARELFGDLAPVAEQIAKVESKSRTTRSRYRTRVRINLEKRIAARSEILKQSRSEWNKLRAHSRSLSRSIIRNRMQGIDSSILISTKAKLDNAMASVLS